MNDFVFDMSKVYKDDKFFFKNEAQYKAYYKVKYNICKQINPKRIAEIGVRAGYSAWTFLQACPNAAYFGFDANNGTHGADFGQDGRYKNHALKLLGDYDTSYMEIDSQTINELPLGINEIDLFHVDGDHSYKGAYHDLDLAKKSLSSSGVILVDDYDYITDVRKAVDDWIRDHNAKFNYIKSMRGEIIIHV